MNGRELRHGFHFHDDQPIDYKVGPEAFFERCTSMYRRRSGHCLRSMRPPGKNGGAAGSARLGAPRIIADRLFATDGAAVVVIDPESGEILRRFRSSAEVSSTPVLAGDRVLFGNVRGVLSAIRPDF